MATSVTSTPPLSPAPLSLAAKIFGTIEAVEAVGIPLTLAFLMPAGGQTVAPIITQDLEGLTAALGKIFGV